MGSCASRPESCVGCRHVGGGRRKKLRKRKKNGGFDGGGRTKVVSDRADKSPHIDHSFTNPTFRGSVEEAWFDSAAVLESDCSDEDFQSVPDDIHSLSGSDTTSITSPRFANVQSTCSVDQPQKPGDSNNRNTVLNSVIGISKNSVHPDDCDSKVKSDGGHGHVVTDVKPVSVDEISVSTDESGCGGENTLLDNCGIIPSNCLPCLASTVPPAEKRNSLSSSSPRKKAALKLPFKWKEGHPNATLFSSKPLLQRPIAGSQVPFCPLDKKIADSWSPVDPSTFRVRGANYPRDKKKDFASNSAAYNPIGLDVFLSPKKINHIARFVELPNVNVSGKLPPLLVVNAQIPLYPATFFQNEIDGEGINFVMYYKLSESYATKLPTHFQDSIRKLIDDEVEKVKGFPGDTTVSFRERLKILGRVANVDELPLSAPERKLMHAYNEKPVLSRPQHEFFEGEYYFEIDLDMHRFSYISRKGFETFLERLKFCILDFGLTIQGNKAEELPENMLCCVRLNEIDYSNYHQLSLSSSSSSSEK